MHQNCCGPWLCPDPTGGAYDVPPTPSWLDATSLFLSPRRLQLVDLGAFGASFIAPQHKFLATPLHTILTPYQTILATPVLHAWDIRDQVAKLSEIDHAKDWSFWAAKFSWYVFLWALDIL